MEENLPLDLGSLGSYNAPHDLLATDDHVEATQHDVDELDEFLDELVYNTHKTKLFATRAEVMKYLDQADVEEVNFQINSNEFHSPHDPDEYLEWPWDIWNAHV